MTQTQIKDFIAGGYFLAKYVPRSEYMSPELMPKQLISASNCIVDILPEVWTVESLENPKTLKKEAHSYKVSADRLPEVLKWVNEHHDRDIGFPNIFYSVDAAKDFAKQFYNHAEAVVILGIGLCPKFVDEFLAAEQAGYGVYESLKRGKSLATGGKILGFEVLGYDYGSFHSWLCNGLEKDAFREFDVRPNNYGFVETLDDAAKCAEYASREEVGAEPALWQSWLVVEYQ